MLLAFKPDDDIKKSLNGKIEVSVRKLLKFFDQKKGLLMRLVEVIGNKNWKSAWLILLSDRNYWYTIQRTYWPKALETSKESPVNNNLSARSNQHDGFWLKNEHFYLKTKDKNILLSSNDWLNDRIMDAVQGLICKKLGT